MNAPLWVGRACSVNFVVLAALLSACGYPERTALGLVVQYVLSTLVWTQSCPSCVLWMDRGAAVYNVVALGAAHVERGAPITTLLAPLLAVAVFFWYKDFTHADYGTVTPWYAAWHATLFACNAAIAIRFSVGN